MVTLSTHGLFDRTRLVRGADALTVAVAVALPWSTSATGILVVLWVLALIPTLNWADVRRDLVTPAGGLPVLLFLLGLIGMMWAGVPMVERLKGLDSFCKLLAIPLLLVQFRRSDRGVWVFGGYAISCTVLLVISTLVQFVPGLSVIPMHWDNVLVSNAATQSGEFVTCIFGILFLAVEFLERRRWLWLFGSLAVALGLLANIFFVATGRTALAIIPVLLVVLVVKKFSVKGILILFTGAILVGVIGWFSSAHLRDRAGAVWTEVQNYEATDARNSSGERLEFWKKSIVFVREAPIFGHGTGSMPSLFGKAAAGQTGAAGSATSNPHNQTFAVAIQLGLLGAAVLWAMWAAHLLLFRGNGLAEWIGLIVVVQNIVGSLFNSHLFDFNQGWVYVFGAGVAGGMALKRRSALGGREAIKQ
jgi:O-antigen ligase